jgi:hypothetical protein
MSEEIELQNVHGEYTVRFYRDGRIVITCDNRHVVIVKDPAYRLFKLFYFKMIQENKNPYKFVRNAFNEYVG